LRRSVVQGLVQLVVLLWVANMIQLGLRYSWGIALPQASAQLELSGFEGGVIASSFYIGYVLTGIPSGILVDKLGTKRVAILALVGVGLLSFFIAASKGFPELLLAFLAAGVIAGPIFPSSLKTLSENLSPNNRATGVGVLETVSPSAMIAAATIFPLVVGEMGWRYVYTLLGTTALLVAVAYYAGVPNTHVEQTREKPSFMEGFTNRRLLLAVSVRLGGMWGIIGISAWYYYIADKVFGSFEAQLLYLSLALAAVAGQVLGGLVSDKHGRGGVAALGMLAFGALLALASATRDLSVSLILAPSIGFTAFFWKSGLDTYILETVQPNQRGSAAGLMNTISQVGSLVAPSAVGYTIDITGLQSPIPFLTLAAGPLIASLIMLLTML
jgi:MFS family permease